MSALLAARGLTLRAGPRTLCAELNLALQPGELWAVLGINGAGKTTLLHALAGLRAPEAGEVELDGHALAGLSRRAIAQRLGLLTQDTPDPFPATVLETALLGRHPFLTLWARESAEDRKRAQAALARVDLAGLEQRPIASLSGGERRRLAFATLLVQSPAVWLLDEPTNHLDLRHQALLLGEMRAACNGGATALLALHDPNLAARHADRVLLLYGDGRWETGPATEVLTAARLSTLYGHPVEEFESDGRRVFVAA